MSLIKYLTLLYFLPLLSFIVSEECNQKNYGDGKLVCVCSSTYCDTFPPLENVPEGHYQIYTTSRSRLGFRRSVGRFENESRSADVAITLNRHKTFQKIIGFGGAFTDSVGINILSLPEGAQNKLLESYFSKDGLEYTICRVPIGGTDFSTRAYSYADNLAKNLSQPLENFRLQREDLVYKIPIIRKAEALAKANNKSLKLIASAWTAPPWMKTNNGWTGIGFLKDQYYQVWADYHLDFFKGYSRYNITFWGMTTGNEPSDGFFPVNLNSMGWWPSNMNKWISNNLGPTIRQSEFRNLKIIIHDDTRLVLPLIGIYLNNEETMQYVDGVAVHWYQDFIIPPSFLNLIKSPHKDVFILNTEACSGTKMVDGPNATDYGAWYRGENYIKDIIEDLEYNVSGWLDWNIALDLEGGPSYIGPNDSPIIVNATSGEFYKQPMFYVMGHFSKFIVPDSVRMGKEVVGEIEVTAFVRPDNLTAIVVYNRQDISRTVQIVDTNYRIITIDLEARSLNTILY